MVFPNRNDEPNTTDSVVRAISLSGYTHQSTLVPTAVVLVGDLENFYHGLVDLCVVHGDIYDGESVDGAW